MGELLIDNQGFFSFRLEEAAGSKGDKIIMRGQFARSDKATENKRLYRENLWRREFGRLAESMTHRRMFGELDHPSDGRTKLQRVSHLVTNLTINGNEVIGEAEVLDTPNGRILKTLAQAKAEVGVSSRGYGSTKTLADGTQEVQEDFRLDTFDFVADPATRTAYPKVFAEEREHIREAEEDMTPDLLRRDYPGLLEAMVAARSGGGLSARDLTEAEERTERRMTERFGNQLRRALEVTEADIRSKVRSELMSDPKVAGALGIVEQIVGLVKSYGIDPHANDELMVRDEAASALKKQIDDKTLEIHRLTQEQARDRALIKELAYRLHIEQSLAGDPSKATIVALIGDVTKLESKDDIDKRIAAIKVELNTRGGARRETAEEKVSAKDLKAAKEELAKAQAKLAEVEEHLASAKTDKETATEESKRYRTAAEQALTVAEGLEVRLHAATAIAEQSALSSRDRTQLIKLCENALSTTAVDEIIEGYVPQRTQDTDEVSRIRDRVTRGIGADRLEEERGAGGGKGNGNGAGARGRTRTNGKGNGLLEEVGGPDVTEFDRLAGSTGK